VDNSRGCYQLRGDMSLAQHIFLSLNYVLSAIILVAMGFFGLWNYFDSGGDSKVDKVAPTWPPTDRRWS
jgi:hypothetical protein